MSLFSLMKNILIGLRPKHVKNDILFPYCLSESFCAALVCLIQLHGIQHYSLRRGLTGSTLEGDKRDVAKTYSVMLAMYRKLYKAMASFQKKWGYAWDNKIPACLLFSVQLIFLSFAVHLSNVSSAKLWFGIPPCYCS